MKSKLIFKILVFIIIFVLSFLFFLDRSCIVVLKVGRSVYLEKITSISYEAIEYSLTNKKELNDLILIEKDNSNNVSFICTNAYKVNNLALSIAKSFKRKIQVEFNKGLKIPIGAFSGIELLSGIGKKVNVELIKISNVKCDFISEFEEMGINQTRHKLSINVVTSAEIICQKKSKKVKSEVKVILFDNLIIGKVPSTYLNGKILGSAVG